MKAYVKTNLEVKDYPNGRHFDWGMERYKGKIIDVTWDAGNSINNPGWFGEGWWWNEDWVIILVDGDFNKTLENYDTWVYELLGKITLKEKRIKELENQVKNGSGWKSYSALLEHFVNLEQKYCDSIKNYNNLLIQHNKLYLQIQNIVENFYNIKPT